MREAAQEILTFVEGADYETFLANRQMRFATERALEIVGEAARRVSPAFREAHPEIPWRTIIGQRNILAHDYAEVRVERIWEVTRVRLPELVAQLDLLIPPS